MKKAFVILISLLVLATLVSCDESNPAEQNPSGEKTQAEDESQQDTSIPDTSKYIFIGENTETIDGIQYSVKSFADVYDGFPYRYVYYKCYYLNGIVRRVYTFHHTEGVCLDYPYTSFQEHMCGSGCSFSIATYSTDGIIQSFEIHNPTDKEVFGYYANGKVSQKTTYSNNGVKTDFESYFEDGGLKEKLVYLFGLAVGSTEYYSNGLVKKMSYLNEDGSLQSSEEYEYYTNGLKKKTTTYYTSNYNDIETIEDRIYEYEYYENGTLKREVKSESYNSKRTETLYTTDGKVDEVIASGSNSYDNYKYKYYYEDEDIFRLRTQYSSTGAVSSESVEYVQIYSHGTSSYTIASTSYDANGKIFSYSENYYQNDSHPQKLYANYSNGVLSSFRYCYESGYLKYYYYSNKLLLLDDNTVYYYDVPNEQDASSVVNPYLQEQAEDLLESLKYHFN